LRSAPCRAVGVCRRHVVGSKYTHKSMPADGHNRRSRSFRSRERRATDDRARYLCASCARSRESARRKFRDTIPRTRGRKGFLRTLNGSFSRENPRVCWPIGHSRGCESRGNGEESPAESALVETAIHTLCCTRNYTRAKTHRGRFGRQRGGEGEGGRREREKERWKSC